MQVSMMTTAATVAISRLTNRVLRLVLVMKNGPSSLYLSASCPVSAVMHGSVVNDAPVK